MAVVDPSDLIGKKGYTRKTDNSLLLEMTHQDLSLFPIGTYTFYLTVRKTIPLTSVVDDTDSQVVIRKVLTVVLAVASLIIPVRFDFTDIDLNIEPRMYVYDIKYNDINNKTASITDGVKQFEVKPDSTRGNS